MCGTTASATDDGVGEFIVDADGTQGWISVDDWSATPPKDSQGNKFWWDGTPYVVGNNKPNAIYPIFN
jgi:hypothetical protein